MNFIFKKVLGGESLTRSANLLSSITSFIKSKSKIFDFTNLVYSEQGLWVVPCS